MPPRTFEGSKVYRFREAELKNVKHRMHCLLRVYN